MVEITLDLDLVRTILTQERRAAAEDLQQTGALRALERSQPRHDARIAAAPDVGTLACRAGCTWCCYFTVDVRAAEVFAILEFVERHFAADEKARVHAEVRTNQAALARLDEDARVTQNLRCPFLCEGRCSIYAVRPQSCRNYHATDVAGCQQSYEHPDDLDIDPEFAAGVYQAGTAHVEGFNASLDAAGFDVRAYELNAALAAALSDPAARSRFESGGRPFRELGGDAVPLEYDDIG
jgi:Fe-S-cluster containining protein